MFEIPAGSHMNISKVVKTQDIEKMTEFEPNLHNIQDLYVESFGYERDPERQPDERSNSDGSVLCCQGSVTNKEK